MRPVTSNIIESEREKDFIFGERRLWEAPRGEGKGFSENLKFLFRDRGKASTMKDRKRDKREKIKDRLGGGKNRELFAQNTPRAAKKKKSSDNIAMKSG